MLNRRDLALMAAMSRGMRGDPEKQKRRGCLGCSPWLMFFLLGLPFDLCLLARALGWLNK